MTIKAMKISMLLALATIAFVIVRPLQTQGLATYYVTPNSTLNVPITIDSFAIATIKMVPTTDNNLFNIELVDSQNKTILARYNETDLVEFNFVGEGNYTIQLSNHIDDELIMSFSFSYVNLNAKDENGFYTGTDGKIAWSGTVTNISSQSLSFGSLTVSSYQIQISVMDNYGKIGVCFGEGIPDSANWTCANDTILVEEYFRGELVIENDQTSMNLISLDGGEHTVVILLDAIVNVSVSIRGIIITAIIFIIIISGLNLLSKKKKDKHSSFSIEKQELMQQTMLAATNIDQRNPSGPYIPPVIRKLERKRDESKNKQKFN